MSKMRWERGQALVLIILAVVGIFGFAALAVDLGRVFAERRHAQAAADTAAMAAALAGTNTGVYTDYSLAAFASLNENGYANDGTRTVIHVSHPPTSGQYAPPYPDSGRYYQVIIDTQVDQIFSQFVYPGPLRVSVEAVARTLDVTPVGAGNALFATQIDDACPLGGIKFDGGSNTTVIGGSIYSNAKNGNGSCTSGVYDGGSGSINVIGGGIYMNQGWTNNGGAAVSPTVTQNHGTQAMEIIPKPDCSGFSAGYLDTATNTFHKGNYTSLIKLTSGTYTFEPGMYCLDQGIEINGADVYGAGVTFVVNGGGIKFTAKSKIELYRPDEVYDTAPDPYNYGGMLIYMPIENTNGIDISGKSGTQFAGTIYAVGNRSPDSQPKCDIGGAVNAGNTEIYATLGLQSNVICSTIGIAGHSNVAINYDPAMNMRLAPRIELAQ